MLNSDEGRRLLLGVSGCAQETEERIQKFIEISLNILDDMERDVQRCRKNGKDVKEKHKLFSDKIIA